MSSLCVSSGSLGPSSSMVVFVWGALFSGRGGNCGLGGMCILCGENEGKGLIIFSRIEQKW